VAIVSSVLTGAGERGFAMGIGREQY
jgi:hypothetical protein